MIDKSYFDGYSNPSIHEEMLNDKARMEAYENAIIKFVKDKIVVDVGAGTGVLSLLAAQGGAQHVYAIEFSDIAINAE